MANPFIDKWLDVNSPDVNSPDLTLCVEKPGARALTIPILADVIKDHFVGPELLRVWSEYPKAADLIRNKLPTYKKIRSGDLGEILATEFVQEKLSFSVPIKRLRHKDDRNTSMRGDDAVGFRKVGKKTRVLKVESKSRLSIGKSVVEDAGKALMKDSARPNPSTLAFIASRLRELNRDEEAKVVEDLQMSDIADDDVEHMLFTLSGNDPLTALKPHTESPNKAIRRHVVGVLVPDHQEFIKSAFEAANG